MSDYLKNISGLSNPELGDTSCYENTPFIENSTDIDIPKNAEEIIDDDGCMPLSTSIDKTEQKDIIDSQDLPYVTEKKVIVRRYKLMK